MDNEISYSPDFEREAKRFSKKYPRFKTVLAKAVAEITAAPLNGDAMGAKLYKIRVENPDKVSGKRGGFRFINYVVQYVEPENYFSIHLLAIYDKSEVEDIQKADLQKLVKKYFPPEPTVTPIKPKPKAKPKKKNNYTKAAFAPTQTRLFSIANNFITFTKNTYLCGINVHFQI